MKWFYKGIIAIINLAMSFLLALGVAGGIWYLYDCFQRQGAILLGG